VIASRKSVSIETLNPNLTVKFQHYGLAQKLNSLHHAKHNIKRFANAACNG
jgi:hypothetical protein